MATIAVDVDLTVCAIDKLWLQWLQNITHQQGGVPSAQINYNLGHYFKESLERLQIDPMSFFMREGVYDLAQPVEGSKEALLAMHKAGHKIIFVSKVTGNHTESKRQWLEREFPFADGFVATDQKHFVNCDYFIDDRNECLNLPWKDTILIKFPTSYAQTQPLVEKCYSVGGWDNIGVVFRHPNLIIA